MKSTDELKVNLTWLIFFRISIPLLCFVELFSFWSDFIIFYSNNELIKTDIVNAYTDSNSLSLFDLYNFLKIKFDLSASYLLYVRSIIIVYCISLLLVILGLLTKMSTIFCIFFQLLITKSYPEIQSGYDYFTTLCFFYIFISQLI